MQKLEQDFRDLIVTIENAPFFLLISTCFQLSIIMSRADDVFDRVVDVHSTKIPKLDLEEMFKKCGPMYVLKERV